MNIRNSSFLISTDSLSSIYSIKKQYTTNPIVSEIQAILTSLFADDKNVVVVWTPWHCGVAGNEQADCAARRAAQLDNTPVKIQLHDDVAVTIKRMLRDAWQAATLETTKHKT